jgi:nitroreductase/NAD-dependent dihydropyrimidine dehydrogenase PreA subunit
MSIIEINQETCNKCGICILNCPVPIYSKRTKQSIPEVTKQNLCISCGHCVAICPNNAIKHSDFPEGSIIPIGSNNIASASELIKLIRTRRSATVFSDTVVGKQMIEDIIEAARFAPSFANLQTTEFIVVQNKEILGKITQAMGRYFEKLLKQLGNPLMKRIIFLALGKQAQNAKEVLLPTLKNEIAEFQKGEYSFIRNAPLLILFHSDERIMSVDVNTLLAVQNAALMAHALGLVCFYTGSLMGVSQRDKSIGQLVSLPEHHKIYGGLAIGHPRFVYKNWIERKKPKITWL